MTRYREAIRFVEWLPDGSDSAFDFFDAYEEAQAFAGLDEEALYDALKRMGV